MISDDKAFTFNRVIYVLVSLGFFAGLLWLFGLLSDVLIPFAAALLLAYMINPFVMLIQKKIKSHTLSVFISLFFVVLSITLFLIVIIPMIAGEVRHMGHLLSALVNDSELTKRAVEKLPPDVWLAVKKITTMNEIKDFFKNDDVLKMAQTVAQKVMPGLFGVLSGATSFIAGLMGLAIVVLYVIFLLFDFQKVQENWQDILPVQYRKPVLYFANDFKAAMQRYFRAQAVMAAIVGVLHAVGFAIIGLPLGVLLGLLIGLLNMVPYLQLLGLIPAAFLAIVHALDTGMSIWLSLGLTGLVFLVVQIIQDAVLVPKIMGKVTGLSPAIIMLSLSIWGKLLGMFGLLIALPMTCLLWAYYQRLIEPHPVGEHCQRPSTE